MTYTARKTKGVPILNNQIINSTVPGPVIKMDEFDKLAVLIVAGTISGGSPTLDVKLQYQEPISGVWCDAQGQTMTQITAAGNYAKDFTNISGRNVRVVPAYGGTGQFAASYITAIPKS